MSNVNRERKLKPHQRKIWTDAFKASLSHVSIEAAERKAWQAVDICERVGAFHESGSSTEDVPTNIPYEEAWECLAQFFVLEDEGALTLKEPALLVEAMRNFGLGKTKIWDFKDAVASFDSLVEVEIGQDESPVPVLENYRSVWKTLALRFGETTANPSCWQHKLCSSMNSFALGQIGTVEFREFLGEIFPAKLG